MFGQRPSFGGFGSTNTASTGFGSSTFGRPAFGAPQTTASAVTPFGMGTQSGTSLFGQSQPSSGGLFGSSQPSAFGSSSGFGSGVTSTGGLFGSTSTQSTSTGLFGSSSSTPGFNANQNQPKPFSFGTTTTNSGATGTSLFGSNTGGSLFSSNIGQTPGTVVKYNAITGTDTMARGGVSHNIQTKIVAITAMKEYDGRSLEELRVEDYIAGRKGPQQQPQQQQQGFGFGNQMGQQTKFGSQPTTSSSWLAQPSSGGLFGAKPAESKPLFGSTQSTGFGTSTAAGGLFGTANSSPFGQSTTAGSSGFSFGQANQNKPGGFSFGQSTTSSSLFGQNTPATQSGTTFGSTGFGFGAQANQQGGGLFGNQNKPAFGAPSSTSSLFSSKPAAGTTFGFGGTSSAASPFGTTNTNTGGGLFGSANQNKPAFSLGSTNTGFGANTSFGSGGLFGANANQAKPGGLTFGSTGGFGSTSQSSGFSFNQPSTGGGLFSNPSGGGGLFGSTGTNFGTGGTNFGGGSNFSLNQNQPNLLGGNMNLNNNINNANIVNNNNISNLIKALTHNPFGTSSLLKSVTPPTGKADELLNSPTNAPDSGSNPSKSSLSTKTPTYVLPSGSATSNKLKPISLNRSFNGTEGSKKKMMFAGLDDKMDTPVEDPFKMKTFPSVKKLSLKVFKIGRNNGSFSSSLEQSTASNSVVNENMSGGFSSSAGNSGLLDTPANTRVSLTPLDENSPTPDIIKGRTNINLLQVANKENMNDTLDDLNVGRSGHGSKGSQNGIQHNLTDLDGVSFFDSHGDDDVEDHVRSTSPHLAGVKLSRVGYYTIPSMDDLAEMVDADGSCLVENFTVGRYGYGNICFQGISNVADLDLDSIVFIVRKEVEVYPEGVTKPTVGEGLNKASYITLDCVWPVDKSTHEVIKCQDRLEAMGWPQYLERQCLKMEATFVEYRPETGSWVFKVKHFSKYGLQDEENEPPPAVQPTTTIAQIHPQSKNLVVLGSEASPKAPLSTSNHPNTIPQLFGGRSSSVQGPPSLGLATTQQSTDASQSRLAEAGNFRRTMFLDGSTADFEENDMSESADDRDVGVDYIPICPLSPSAERLTLSSKAPPTAIQSLKSQLFFDDIDESIEEHPSLGIGTKSLFETQKDKGEKRDIDNDAVRNLDNESSLFSSRVHPKKFLLGDESRMNETSGGVSRSSFAIEKGPSVTMATRLEKTSEIASSSLFFPAAINVDMAEVQSESLLLDPRTEYQLLSSYPDPDFELDSAPVNHMSSHIPLEHSLISKIPKGICDMAAYMGRSFRVGWGPRLTLVHVGRPLESTNMMLTQDHAAEERRVETTQRSRLFNIFGSYNSSLRNLTDIKRCIKTPKYSVTLEKLHIKDDENGSSVEDGSEINPLLESCLQDVLDCCHLATTMNEPSPETSDMGIDNTIDTNSDRLSCPLLFPEKGIQLLHRLAVTASKFQENESLSTPMSLVFGLCAALWGHLDFYSPDIDGDSQYVQDQARKEALSIWLENVSQKTVSFETKRALLGVAEEDYLDAVFSHLTARQISEACEVCQDKGDHHLALLLSQSCLGDQRPRQIMKEQLSNWAWSGLDAHMSPQRLTLYTLLAGTSIHDSSQGTINTLIGLDWRRCLAILMWYISPSTSSIAEILKNYESAAGVESNSREDSMPYCETPMPPYTYNEPLPDNIKVNHDICFQLLKLYTDRSHPLETLLEASSYTPDPLDAGTSWLVWCILQSLDYTLLAPSKVEALHMSMVAILESQGSWHWAAFVVLSIPDQDKRKSTLMELLTRYLLVVSEEGSSNQCYLRKENFILNKLKIPLTMVHKAKAIRAKSKNLDDEEAWYLLQCGDLNAAHKIILDSIAPKAINNQDYGHLQTYLREFQKKGMHENVVGWEDGGAIYLAYLDLIDRAKEMGETREVTGPKVEKLKPKLHSLCFKLNNLETPTLVHKLCIAEMSKTVVRVLRGILIQLPDGVRVLAEKVASLPLTHECALEELNHITHHYLANLSHDIMDTA